jgi:signal peptidase I
MRAFPAGQGWDTVAFPGADLDEGAYALEITGDSMLPLYREGDIIIVSPTAQVRRGDRVVVKTHAARGDGEDASAPDIDWSSSWNRQSSASAADLPGLGDRVDGPDRLGQPVIVRCFRAPVRRPAPC